LRDSTTMEKTTMSKFAQTCCAVALAVMVGSASQGQSGGPISRTGTSPRLQKLKQQLAAGVHGATDDFWAVLAREHTPLIEPVPGDPKHLLVTFIWRNQPQTKSVQVFGMEMTLLPNTDIWYVTFMTE